MNEEITFVPYKQEGEPERKAAFVKVHFDTSSLSKEELQILGILYEAVDFINPIYQDQFEPHTPLITKFVRGIIPLAEGEERKALEDYAIILDLQNSPFNLLKRKNHLLQLDETTVRKLVEKIQDVELKVNFEIVAPFLFNGKTLSATAGFYPNFILQEEFDSLGDKTKIVNSTVRRTHMGELEVVLNEERYKSKLKPIINLLRIARDLTTNISFRHYIDTKIIELTIGTDEARQVSDYAWIRHSSNIDLILSTALEVYLDDFKNIRGAAAGAVMIKNSKADELLKSLVETIPELEAIAPWEHKKQEFDPDKSPKLKFVDVLNWAGDYVNSPQTIVAQSLPNNEWIKQNVGTVNLIYKNIGEAIYKVIGNRAAEEFLPIETYEKYQDMIFEATQLHFALHELGHTTGIMDPKLGDVQPNELLESEYSTLEELRAELFGLFALPTLVKKGIITEDQMITSYQGMIISMVNNLKFEPKQAHTNAKNMMWHYFIERGAIEIFEEGGKAKYQAHLPKIHEVTDRMLGRVGYIKASGSKIDANALRRKYCFTDLSMPIIEERTKDFPLGRGLIFPKLEKDGDRYNNNLIYPTSFSEQQKFKILF